MSRAAYPIICDCSPSAMQVLPGLGPRWKAWLVVLDYDRLLVSRTLVGEADSKDELIVRTVAEYGAAYRYGRWEAPDWTLVVRQSGVEAFVGSLTEVSPSEGAPA